MEGGSLDISIKKRQRGEGGEVLGRGVHFTWIVHETPPTRAGGGHTASHHPLGWDEQEDRCCKRVRVFVFCSQ